MLFANLCHLKLCEICANLSANEYEENPSKSGPQRAVKMIRGERSFLKVTVKVPAVFS